jgi:hypothetical protein
MTDVYIVEGRPLSNVEPPPRQLPQSTVQLVAQTSDALIGGMSKTPLMLGIIVLNISALLAAVYFLNLLIAGQQQHLKSLVDTLTKQQTEIITMHKAEFDALLEINNKLAIPIPISPIAPSSQTLTQPPARSR